MMIMMMSNVSPADGPSDPIQSNLQVYTSDSSESPGQQRVY